MSFGIPVRNGLGLGLLASTSLATRNTSVFSPASLFAAGEQGVWYDPSDLTTLFQDSTGTTPVTAVEQFVGRMLDKSGRNNHATQSTDPARPRLSARVNLLTKTEQFDDAAWVKQQATIAANVAVAPDGTTTADRVSTINAPLIRIVGQTFSLPAVNHTISVWVKASAVGNRKFRLVANQALGSAVGTASSVFTATDDWQQFSFTATGGSGYWGITQATAPDFDFELLIWGADLRATNDGVGLPVYQRVNTSTDYDTTGFPLYLAFDGTDDRMATANISFTSTDKMTVWGGVRKFVDTSLIICELSVNAGANVGSFYLSSGIDGAFPAGYTFLGRGSASVATALVAHLSPAVTAPNTSVLAATGNISGDLNTIRRNTVLGSNGTGDQGSGNYGDYPLCIGARGTSSSSLWFNGRIYSLIVRGAASTAQQISDTETWVNARTKAYA
jgi:hypothetical protein